MEHTAKRQLKGISVKVLALSLALMSSTSSQDAPASPKMPTTDASAAKSTEAVKKTSKAKAAPKKKSIRQNAHTQTIEKVLAAAYNYNSEIRAQRAALRAANERIVQAKSGFRPNITLEGTTSITTQINSGSLKDLNVGGQVNNPGRSDNRAGNAAIKASQNIFQGFNTIASVAEAENSRLAAVSQLNVVVQKVFSDVITAYLDLLSLTAQVRLLKSQVNTNQETLNASQEKFKVGEETRTSVAQAESQLADFTAQMQAKEAQLEAAKATFTRLTGLKPEGIVKPGEFSRIPQSLSEAIERGVKSNPSIQAAKYTAEAAHHTKDKESSALYPRLDVEASSSINRQNLRSRPEGTIANPYDNSVQHQALLRASMPLYEAGLIRAKRREAYENSERARVDIETSRRDVIEKLAQSWSNFKTAKANMTSYQAQVAAQEVSLEGTRQEMAVGTKILLDVLDEQSKLVRAQQNLVNAERDYYIAGYQLMALLGILTENELGLDVEKYDPDAHYNEVANSW